MNEELTTRLSRQLHEQVDGWHDAPLTLEGVRGKARSIRRTRRIAAGAAVAAAFAVVTPTALLLGDGPGGRADREIPPASTTTAPEQEPSALGIPYLEGRTLTMPDGAQTRLPSAYDGVVVLGDQVYGIGQDPGTFEYQLDRLGDSGAIEESVPLAGGAVAPNTEGSAFAYVRGDGELVIESGAGRTPIGKHGNVQPVRLLGGPDCAETADTCVVFFNQEGEQPPAAATNFGAVNAIDGGGIKLNDVAEDGRFAIQTESRIDGSCSGVYDSSAGGFDFETCTHSLFRFSPDGTHLSASDAYLDGIGQGWVAILDAATGEETARYEPEDAFLTTWVWEDAEHLLALQYDFGGGEWSVVRLGVDGSIETALGPSKGDEMRPPWRLAGAS